MVRTLISAAIYILAHAVGLLVASLVLGDSFTFTAKGFIVATLLLSLIEIVVGPLITRMSEKNIPALKGGVALVTTFVGLLITNAIVGGMQIQGISTWLIATLLVWIGALIAGIVLPMIMAKKTVEAHRQK
ncbi:superfamily IV 4 TMS phage holin [Aliiruegeria haliotis]|uniref:Superfamily IV 4 TMS phage holin n=1 Tax=Aliiruegeria haliotis TaxID=1280846 RepID=A0A2T0RRL6_9RHOB|nr:phage holin family protein [Aliiruegeria haliotis]PRY23846.1 superfamily IV 4 TMS phage holin [Aliiruegeria haliotis]